MSAPEYKYTDRDVREDLRLEDVAYEYLETYGGEFEPLVMARATLEKYGRLSTSQIRVVLNCMRHDWNVAAELPIPERVGLAEVIEMPKRKPKKGSYYEHRPTHEEQEVLCDVTVFHRPHTYEGFYERNGEKIPYPYMSCPGRTNGRPYSIEVPLLPKVPYVKARNGKMIHLVSDSAAHTFIWHPNLYGWGYDSGRAFRHEGARHLNDPDAIIMTKCRYPSVINNGILIAELPEGVFNPDGTKLKLCKHCTAVEED